VDIEGNEVVSVHTDVFQSQGKAISRSVPVKALRSAPERVDYRLQHLDAKLIGESELMLELKRSIRTVASSSETVLIASARLSKGRDDESPLERPRGQSLSSVHRKVRYILDS